MFISSRTKQKTMNKYLGYLTSLGEILVVVGAAVWITGWEGTKYVFAAGTLLFLAGRLLEKHPTDNLTLKRLYRQRMIGCIMLLVSAVMMLFYDLSPTGWLIPFIVFAVAETYTAFRIPKIENSINETH